MSIVYLKRNSWVAGLFALILSPAFSMLYIGRWRWAIVYFIVPFAVPAAIMAGLHYDILPPVMTLTHWLTAFAIIFVIISLVHIITLNKLAGCKTEKHWYSSTYLIILVWLDLLILSFAFRTFAYQPFHAPSGSMKPSIKVGDYFFAEKFAYSYNRFSFPFDYNLVGQNLIFNKPVRGDVAVFRAPNQSNITYVKRIIGLPGDTIQMKEGILHINNTPVKMQNAQNHKEETTAYQRYIETLPNNVSYYIYNQKDNTRFDNTKAFTVPTGHYFVMGDNRDNSLDSRAEAFVGSIPYENLIGKVNAVWWSNVERKFVNRNMQIKE